MVELKCERCSAILKEVDGVVSCTCKPKETKTTTKKKK